MRQISFVLALWLALITCSVAVAQTGAAKDDSVIASGDWSEPLLYGRHTLRGRLSLHVGHPSAASVGGTELMAYLELQNVSAAIGPPATVFIDLSKGLRCEVKDANGKPIPSIAACGGYLPEPVAVLLPYDATIQIRINPGCMPMGCSQLMSIRPYDKNVYTAAASFTVAPKNDADDAGENAWRGTLILPELKVTNLPIDRE